MNAPLDNTEKGKELTQETLDAAIHAFQDQAASSLTEMMNKSMPKPVDVPELKQAILSSLDISPVQQKIQSAFKSISYYLQRSIYAVEMQEIQDNWMSAYEQLMALLENQTERKQEDLGEPLQTLIGLSAKTYDSFYAAGLDLFDQEAFEKASEVFFLLALFNYCYSNVWISLGLSEQKCGRLEPALNAFAMGVITNPDSPESYLYAAECCIAMNDLVEAKTYLEEALTRLDKDPQYESFRAVATKISKQI